MRPTIWVPTLWLGNTSAGVDFVDESEGIVQPEEQWLHTAGYSTVVLAVFNYSGLNNTALYLEGTDTPAGGWVTVTTFQSGSSSPEMRELTRVRQRSNTSGRLWEYMRWRWGPEPGGSPNGLDGETACFKIQVVMKP